jgi:hypothetical protein
MIERINPFQFNTFGYYSQGVKIDLGTKTMILVAGIEVMAIIDNA